MEDLDRKLEALGFVFTQPEHCEKGKMFICVDCFPCIFETGENESFSFETYDEFYEIYKKHISK